MCYKDPLTNNMITPKRNTYYIQKKYTKYRKNKMPKESFDQRIFRLKL